MNICAYPAEQVLLLFARGFTTLHMEQDLAARQVIATRKRSGAVVFKVFFFFLDILRGKLARSNKAVKRLRFCERCND